MRYGLEEAKKELQRELKRQIGSAQTPVSFPAVVRVEVPLVDIDPLLWLAGQASEQKMFWRGAGTRPSIAGIGIAFESSAQGWYGFEESWGRANELMRASPAGTRLFSSMSFLRTMSAPEWSGFPAVQFILPAVELVQDEGGCRLAATAVRGRDGEPFNTAASLELEKVRLVEQVSPHAAAVVARSDVPDYEDWVSLSEGLLESLERGDAARVVIARRVTLGIEGPLSPELVLRSMIGRRKDIFAYLFCNKGRAFWGTSTDLLYARHGARVRSAAVAGEGLVEIFRELCRCYQVDCHQRALCSGLNQQLLMQVSGALSEGVTDKEFLQALHPAPSVCGVPAEKARLLSQECEAFERGLFCGPVGLFGRDEAEIAAASSACLFDAGQLHVYGSAPFVKGSDPFTQWEIAGGAMKNIVNVVQGA